MPHWPLRPRLVIVALLALCDYLLWNWSLSANHDVLALVSGMTLIPLLLALAWLLVLAVAHLLAGVAQRSQRSRARHAGRRVGAGARAGATAGASASGERGRGSNAGADGAPAASPSSKLAA